MAILTVNIDTPPIPTGNTLWVDAVNGDDSTGTTGRQDKPYLTPTAAKADAVSGDLIWVRPGTYTITSNLAKDGVNWYFDAGTSVVMNMDANGSIFDDEGSAMSFQVSGYGTLTRGETTQAEEFSNVIRMTNAGSVFVISATVIENTCMEESAIEGSPGTSAIFHAAGTLTVNVTEILSKSYAYYWETGPAWINANRIIATGNNSGDGDGVYCKPPDDNADNVYVAANEIRSAFKSAVYSSLAESYAPEFRLWVTSEVIAGGSVGVQQGSGKVYITAQKISASQDGGIVIKASGNPSTELYVTTQKIGPADSLTEVNNTFTLVEAAGGAKVRIECMEYDMSPITTWGVTNPLFSISSTTPIDCELIGGTIVLPALIDTQVIGNSASTGGGRRVFSGMRIDNSAAGGSASAPVVLTDDLTILDGCTLVTAASASIDAAIAKTITAEGANTIYQAVGANVTVEGNMQLDNGAAPFGHVPIANADGTWSWGDPVIQVTGLTLLDSGWSLVGGLYEYDLANVNILATSIVEVIPDNDDASIVQAAVFLPRTDSSSGSVKVYATNEPTGDIGVTINIYNQ